MVSAVQTPLSIVRCPTRSATALAPSRPGSVLNSSGQVDLTLDSVLVARSDYAVNEGDFYLTTAPVDPKSSTWTTYSLGMSGICYQRSQTQSAAIEDGLSHTYLVGEKFVSSLY